MPSEIKVLAPSHQLQEQKTPKLPRKISCVLLGGEAAGKTSLLRRYFHGRFEDHRRPTLGADFYTRRIPWTTESDSDTPKPPSQPPLSMQVWDTPGRERFAANRKAKYTAAFPDSFFKNVDVALLVYDMTSSASFTHALKWHADLVARIQRMEAAGERTRPFPILVAATKMDIKARDTHPSSRPRSIGNQRAVMGFNDFKGKEIRYEYTANQPSSSKSKSSKKKQSQSHRKRLETSTYAGVGVDQISYLEDSFFTNDARGSYLESLLSTEDGSDPDRDMVLLWCHRNGLSHHEVSSLDGRFFNAFSYRI